VAVLAEAKSEIEVSVIRQRDATMRLIVGWFGGFLWADKTDGAETFWDILTGTLERSVIYGGK
jgi:hypothetical protein